MTASRTTTLAGLLFGMLLVTSALAHRPSQGQPARVGKSPRLAASAREGRRLNDLANRAQRLVVLGRDPELAESLIKEAIAGSALVGWPYGEIYAGLLESQNRWEEARVQYRPIVWPADGKEDPRFIRPYRLMHYALLSRKASNSREEQATLARIPGDTRLQKMTAAYEDAKKAYQSQEAFALLLEVQRLDPGAKWLVEELVEARRDMDEEVAARRNQAAEMEAKLNP